MLLSVETSFTDQVDEQLGWLCPFAGLEWLLQVHGVLCWDPGERAVAI